MRGVQNTHQRVRHHARPGPYPSSGALPSDARPVPRSCVLRTCCAVALRRTGPLLRCAPCVL